MNCSAFKRDLYHFQADELPAAERDAYHEHLDACAPCAALLEVEQALLRGLRARLTPAAPPPGLETRVREQLRQAGRSSRPGLDWVRKPWFAAMVTAEPNLSPEPMSDASSFWISIQPVSVDWNTYTDPCS